METPEPAKLIGGPYEPPAVRAGDWLDDAVDGRLQVGGWSNGPIPWPRRKKTGTHSLVLFGDLVRAVRLESSEAVQHWFGVSAGTVWKWRCALGVDRITNGTRELLRERTGVPQEAAARGRDAAAAPEALARMAESKAGKPAHPNTRAALLRAARAPKPAGWGSKANVWMRKL